MRRKQQQSKLQERKAFLLKEESYLTVCLILFAKNSVVLLK